MDGDAQIRLATYGTLAPGRPNHHQLTGLRGAWRRGVVRGRLFAEGWGAAMGYPGLVLDPAGPEVEVQLFESADLPAHWPRLDAFEGEGYRRAVVPIGTADGELNACIYVLAETPPAVLRPATERDLDGVADVWHASALRMDGAPADLSTRDELRERIDRELAAGWELYLATRGGTPVAMLALKPALGVLDQIFVLPGEQGNGLGTALLGLAQRLMPGGFILRTAAANLAARAFYERRGLRLVGHERHPRTGAPSCAYGWEP